MSPRCCYPEGLLNWESVYTWEQLGYPTWLVFLEGFNQIQKPSLTKDSVHYCRCTPDFLLTTTGASCPKCLTPGTACPPAACHGPSTHPSIPFPGHTVKSILSPSGEVNKARELASIINLPSRIYVPVICKCLIHCPFTTVVL